MRIVIAVDSSRASEAALAAVSHHKWPENSLIKLIYVVSNSPNVLEKIKGEVRHPDVESTRAAIEEVTLSLSGRMPSTNVSCEILEGDPKAAIVKFARQWKSDLIVMGCQMKSGIDKLLMGSVSAGVLSKADCPVLLIKDGSMASHIKHGIDFTRILVASDGRASSKAAFAWLARQTWPDDVVYKVVSVIPQDRARIENTSDTQKAAWLLRQWSSMKEKVLTGLRKDAETLGRGLDNEYISVDVIPGNPKEKIVDLGKNWRAELIVTGAESKSHLDKIFAGSVSKSIADRATCSILVVKGLDKEGERLTDKKKERLKNTESYAGSGAAEMKREEQRNQSAVQDRENDAPFKMF